MEVEVLEELELKLKLKLGLVPMMLCDLIL